MINKGPKRRFFLQKQRVLIFVLFLFACAPVKKKDEETKETSAKNDLPAMTITKLDGVAVDLKNLDNAAVLIFFRPDCDHCQREAKKIKENLISFKNYSVYFIASDPIQQIEKFAFDYELKEQPNVFFGWTASENIVANFGSISAPSLYIYSQQQTLVKSFNGETPISSVLSYL